ncbi:hypothetical protein [Bifidobacterium phage PMBT6]|nr:hypothetical protein [Bifidobacterium phage PMBT6]QDF14858.1 DivIVA domain-containing protein [Bifidobacterium phage PMBT6]
MRPLTPHDVHTARLDTTRFRTGYDCDQVDRLLDQCETTIRILAQALKQTSIQLRALGDQFNNARTKPTEEAK